MSHDALNQLPRRTTPTWETELLSQVLPVPEQAPAAGDEPEQPFVVPFWR